MASVKDPVTPSLTIGKSDISINLSITGTDAQIANQGYTYNQAGFTYDQIGIQYGGVYNTNEDVLPMILSAQFLEPMNLSVSDIYGRQPKPATNHFPLGPGFFMFVTTL